MSCSLRIAEVEEVPEGTVRAVLTGNRLVVVFHLASGLHVTDPTCSMHGAPLDRAIVLDDQTVCSWHGVAIDPATGRCSIAARAAFRSYAVEVRDGGVYIDPSEVG
jgi:nitrite reductase/ring-hydroxylating ferredoxin subunit